MTDPPIGKSKWPPHGPAPDPGYCDGDEEVRHFSEFHDDFDYIMLWIYGVTMGILMVVAVIIAMTKTPDFSDYHGKVSVVCTEDGRCWDVDND